MQKISEQRSGPAGAAAFFSAIHEDPVCLPRFSMTEEGMGEERVQKN